MMFVAVVVVLAGIVNAQYFDFARGDELWPVAFPACGADADARSGHLASPLAVPDASDGTAAVTASVGARVSHIAPFGDPVLAPAYSDELRGFVVVVDGTFLGTQLVFNNTAYTLHHVLFRRPAEHLPAGVAYGTDLAGGLIEQQVAWTDGNATSLFTARLFADDANAALLDAAATAAPTDAQRVLLERVGETLATGGHFADIASGETDGGLTSGPHWMYEGTLTLPPCEPVTWLVDPTVYLVRSGTVGAYPVGKARPPQPADPSGLAARSRWIGIEASTPTLSAALPFNATAPSVTRIALDFSGSHAQQDAIAEGVVLQAMLYMLVALVALAALGIGTVVVLRVAYRPQARSTWVNPRTGVQYFGFGPSTLYRQELDASDEEDEEEEEDGAAHPHFDGEDDEDNDDE